MLVGGRRGPRASSTAREGQRQPGSAFKPFVYLAALENGMTPDSVVHDLPIVGKGWSPGNDDGELPGRGDPARGAGEVDQYGGGAAANDAGTAQTVEAARLGITLRLRPDASLALGTSEVTLLELTGAYGAFATGGRLVEPHIIKRVRTGSGRVLYQRPDESAGGGRSAASAPSTTCSMRCSCQAPAARGAAAASGRRQDRHDADFRDAWFVGYTAH